MSAVHMSGSIVEHIEEECPGAPLCECANQFHPLAVVEDGATVGRGVSIWRWTLVRNSACIGRETRVGSLCVIDHAVQISDNCKIQDGAKIYGPCRIGRKVFIGPNVVICNDKYPGVQVTDQRTKPVTIIEDEVSIGAGSVILPGIIIKSGIMVGAGSIVTKSLLQAGGVYYGNPARWHK